MLKTLLTILTGRDPLPSGASSETPQSHSPQPRPRELREFVHLGYQFRIALSESNATIEKLVFKPRLEETQLGTKLVPGDEWDWKYISTFPATTFEDAFRLFVDSISNDSPVQKTVSEPIKEPVVSRQSHNQKTTPVEKTQKNSDPDVPVKPQEVWTGTILSWGTKKFQNSTTKQFYDSFFVEIRLKNGTKRDLKGVLLEKALEDCGAQEGDLVKVKLLGREYVTTVDPITKNPLRALMGIWEMQRV